MNYAEEFQAGGLRVQRRAIAVRWRDADREQTSFEAACNKESNEQFATWLSNRLQDTVLKTVFQAYLRQVKKDYKAVPLQKSIRQFNRDFKLK